jgi:AcrR family transcriptional regulator
MMLEAAPPRGRYDRQLPSDERFEQHAERLLLATARAVEMAPTAATASVGAIVALAGMGRNTFYAHFRDAHAAEEAVLARFVEQLNVRVDAELAQPSQPPELFVRVLRGWTAAIDDRRALVPAAFKIATGDQRGGLSRIGSHVRQHLRRVTTEARRHAAIATPADELRLLAVAASMETLLSWYIDHPSARDDVIELGTDLLVRAFR